MSDVLYIRSMKTKRLKKVTQNDFDDIYNKRTKASQVKWQKLFSDTIEQCNNFCYTSSFWYIGDFVSSKIVEAGGEIEGQTPLRRSDWLGLHPNEIGKLIHPLDVPRMMAFTVFISTYLANKTQKQRDKLKISMLFRMLNGSNQYTWRILHYPKMVYEGKVPKFIFCLVSDQQHLIKDSECTMFILDGNDDQSTLYFCDDEKVELKIFSQQKPLSSRELEVIKLLAKGLISKEIGSVLKISKNTVENHKQNIFTKTGVKNLAELVAFAHTNGLA